MDKTEILYDEKKICDIIEKYYKYISFPSKYDEEFYNSLSSIKISPDVSIDSYDYNEKDGKKNFLSYLYMCEALREKYRLKNIPEEIMKSTLKDMIFWTNTWSSLRETLYLGEIEWLSNHLKMKLFRLGRLQFKINGSEYDVPEKNLRRGDNVVEIHIPGGDALTYEKCCESISLAKEFFAEYFPEYEYSHFTCGSWLMDDTLDKLLPETSNIIKFKNMFERYHREESDSILKYTFNWDTTRKNLEIAEVKSSLAMKVKEYIKNGNSFYTAFGVIDK